MVLDIDYLKKILLAFHSSEKACIGILEFPNHDLDQMTEEFVFHILLLADTSLVQTESGSKNIGFERPGDGRITWYRGSSLRLTAEGHEFTTALKNDVVWKRIKNEFHDQSIIVLQHTTKSLVSELINQQLRDGFKNRPRDSGSAT